MLAGNLARGADGMQGGWNFGPGEDGLKDVAGVVDYLCRTYGGSVEVRELAALLDREYRPD